METCNRQAYSPEADDTTFSRIEKAKKQPTEHTKRENQGDAAA